MALSGALLRLGTLKSHGCPLRAHGWLPHRLPLWLGHVSVESPGNDQSGQG